MVAIDTDPRQFLRTIQQASHFEHLLSLTRLHTISSLNDLHLIDWQASWSCLHHFPDTTSASTSLLQQSAFIFKVKLFLAELPLLATVQRRRPDLYQSTWLCPCCASATEDWSHFWTCPSRSSFWSTLSCSFQDCLCECISSLSSASPAAVSQVISALPCWSSSPISSPTGLCFSDLLRDFSPMDLVSATMSFKLSYSYALAPIQTALHEAQCRLYNDIWLPRCDRMIEFERSKGITKKLKKKRAPSSSTLTSNRAGASAPAKTVLSSCFTWIDRFARTGLPWQDFLTYINNLFADSYTTLTAALGHKISFSLALC